MTQDTYDSDLPPDEVEYFNKQFFGSNIQYWQRLGDIDFTGKSVLDIGCGHGALSIHAAQNGAKRVVGVDIDADRIYFARKNVEINYPELCSIVSFYNEPLESVTETFDLAVSKDSFEHIEDLGGMMRAIAARLSDDGLLVTGFSPLYFSPFGDHGRYWRGSHKIPWLPVLLPEAALFRLASRRRKEYIRSATDVGLNKLTPAQFKAIIAQQGWEVVSLQTNRGGRAGIRLMTALSRFPLLEKYFTVNIYAQLRKPVR